MTGWRLAYAVAHADIIREAGKIQSHSTSNPSSISQLAAIEALGHAGDEVAKMHAAYVERRAWLVPALNEIPGVECPMPDGAFYVFLNVSPFYGQGDVRDSISLSNYLLEKARVAVVPGSAFGQDDYIRISYATSTERIQLGVARMKEAFGELRGTAGNR